MRKTKKPTSSIKDLEYYWSLTYPYELIRDEDGSFVASHPQLIGCMAMGETADEAVKALDLARRVWLEVRHEEGLPIPEPVDAEEYSGKVLLRMPPALHATLAKIAQQQDASLNQLVNNALSEFVGAQRRESELATKLLDVIARSTSPTQFTGPYKLEVPLETDSRSGSSRRRTTPTRKGSKGYEGVIKK
jgi:antitoxin HicB